MEIQEIFNIIKASQTIPTWVINARAYNKDLDALVNGTDFVELLIRIEHKEDEAKCKARRRYSRSIKDVFERLLRPIDFIYSATGGVKIYPKDADKITKKIRIIRDGKTLEKWLQDVWMPLYNIDPNGVILYEWKGDNFYPTYKSIGSIRNYEADGQALKWILFEPINKDNERLWRFIDEEKDWFIKDINGNYTVIEEESYINPFGRVAGFVISDIIKIGTQERLAPIHPIIELSKEYLRDQSIKTIFKFLNGMPIFWRYAIQCDKCHGTGKTGNTTCPDCFEGFYVKKDITDCVTLPVPIDKDQPIIAPNIGGFLSPDLTTWDQYTKELDFLYNVMYETIWGVDARLEVRKTATEVIFDEQPKINKLNVIADIAQWTEWYMTELVIDFLMHGRNKEENSCTILYGRDYILTPVQILLDRYENSKSKGDNSTILDRLLYEWILSKYKNDPQTMNEELLRLKIEPFIHYTVEQIKSNYGGKEAKQKMLFSHWWSNIADKTKTVEVLESEFESYCNEEINNEEIILETTPEIIN